MLRQILGWRLTWWKFIELFLLLLVIHDRVSIFEVDPPQGIVLGKADSEGLGTLKLIYVGGVQTEEARRDTLFGLQFGVGPDVETLRQTVDALLW